MCVGGGGGGSRGNTILTAMARLWSKESTCDIGPCDRTITQTT